MWVIAKENPKNPEGFSYFKKYEYAANTKYPMNTIFLEDAMWFERKSEAIPVYWEINHFFFGYKLYEINNIDRKKDYNHV
jgi:hypothetical protein